MTSFQANGFLAGLYASTGPEPDGDGPELPAEDVANTTTNISANLATNISSEAITNTPDDEPCTGWELKPDASGRLGLEAPALPDNVAWWRRCDFDDLPEPVWPGYLGDPRGAEQRNGTFFPGTTYAGSPGRNGAAP
jgi:hypothetical protein